MRTFAAFTTFHPKGLQEYGQQNISSFHANWPKSVDYYIYAEGFKLEPKDNIKTFDLLSVCPELVKLKERHKDNPKANGRNESMKEESNFLYDLVRFSHKSYAMFHAIENIPTDYVIWLDGDSHTHTKLPLSVIEHLCPEDTLVSFLGRGNHYTETGFLAFNKRHPRIRDYAKIAKNIYDNDLVFSDPYFKQGFTDCHVFDYARKKLESEGVKTNNLSGNKIYSHPFVNTLLGNYMDHLKGKRKYSGTSKQSDIRNPEMLKNDYWKKVFNK